jgi:hypothetical protein
MQLFSKYKSYMCQDQPWAACGPRAACEPFKLFRAALLKALKNHYFTENSTRSVVKVYILALDMTYLQKFGPRTDLGCP